MLVLYEEGLDEEVLSGAVNAIRHADTLIIGGTSLVVYPAAGLIRYFRGDHLVVINMQPTGADAEADLVHCKAHWSGAERGCNAGSVKQKERPCFAPILAPGPVCWMHTEKEWGKPNGSRFVSRRARGR